MPELPDIAAYLRALMPRIIGRPLLHVRLASISLLRTADPPLSAVDGVGNAYSDEILHAAQLSPIAQTHKLKPADWERLFDAARSALRYWIDRLRTETAMRSSSTLPASPARFAANPSHGSAMQIMKRIIVRVARPAASC